jgi:uncharacterized membrane protein
MDLITFKAFIEAFAFLFGLVGAILVIYGGFLAVWRILRLEFRKAQLTYGHVRRDFTRKLVFGLEFFIAADVLRTLITPGMDELLMLAFVVGIRTVLGYFLEREASLSSVPDQSQ